MENNDHSSEDLDNYQPYAVASTGAIIKRFYIYLKSNERYSIPYSLLPTFILKGNQELIIKAYELQVTITGRNLDPIEQSLSLETLTYIKESLSGKDDGQHSTFIERVLLEGENLMS